MIYLKLSRRDYCLLYLEDKDIMIYTDNWAFLHIPKNAGINFRNRVPKELVRGENYIPMQFIADNLQNSIISEPHPLGTFPSYGRWWHNPISYQLKHIPQLNKLPWITIIRHPADRLVSWFHFVQKRRIARGKTSWNITFESFILDNGLKEMYDRGIDSYNKGVDYPMPTHTWPLFFSYGGNWKPQDSQCKWIYELDNIDVKCFRKEDEFEKMEDYVGFKFSDTQYNSTIHDSWETYYTDEMREIVYERYKEDYERLGYDI